MFIGIDIVSVNRFKKLYFKWEANLQNKLFCKKEIALLLNYKKREKWFNFACAFCLKEAALKALFNKGFENIWFRDIKITKIKKLEVVFKNQFLNSSLTHDSNYIIGVVVC